MTKEETEQSFFEELDLTPTRVLNAILLIAISVMVISLIFIISDIIDAKKSCEELEGNYSLNSLLHKCNGKVFYRYSDGSWSWSRNFTVDFSSLNSNKD